MVKRTWIEYNLSGCPTLSTDDYTIDAKLDTNQISIFLRDIDGILLNNDVIQWTITGYWGCGKSTFLYNLANHLNERYFFKKLQKIRDDSEFSHILSIYLHAPTKYFKILNELFNDGFPITHNFLRKKDQIQEIKNTKLHLGVQKITLLFLDNLCEKDIKMGLKVDWFKPSSSFESHEEWFSHYENRIDIIINYIIERGYAHVKHECLELTSINDVEIKLVMSNIGFLLYPIKKIEFIKGFKEITFREGKELRNPDLFHIITKIAKIHLIYIFDEVQDWQLIKQLKLDKQILSMLLNQKNSLIMAFRKENILRMRKSNAFDRYLAIRDILDAKTIPRPSIPDIFNITESVLSTSRIDHEKGIFPFTKEFIIKLSRLTKKGRYFNPRFFVKAIINLLTKSLEWNRSKITFNEGDIEDYDVKSVLIDTEISIIKREYETAHSDRIRYMKNAVAMDIAHRLLRGEIPHNRHKLEEIKTRLALLNKSVPPSDIEILAALDSKRERDKIIRIFDSI